MRENSYLNSFKKFICLTNFIFLSQVWVLKKRHMISYFWSLRLQLNRVHIFLGASISVITAWRIQKVLDISTVLGSTSSDPSSMVFFFFVKYMNGYEPQLIPYNTLLGLKDTSISGNSRLWVESKPQQNFRVTGFRWAIALSGSGTLFMQGKQSTPCLL